MKPTFLFYIFLSIGISTLNELQAQVKVDTIGAFQHYQKGDSLLEIKDYKKSISLFEKALPIYQKAKTWERVAACYNKISSNQLRANSLEKSLKTAQKALEICQNEVRYNSPEKANAYHNIGVYHQKKTNYDLSLSNLQKALNIRKKHFSENHLKIAISLKFIGNHYYYMRKYKKAIEYWNNVVSKLEKHSFEEHSLAADTYSNLGGAYFSVGDYDKSLVYSKKSLNLRQKKESKTDIAYSFVNIGNLSMNLGLLDQAEEYCERAIPLLKSKKDVAILSFLYNNMGNLYSAKGEKIKAVSYLNKSLDLKIQVYGENHDTVATTYNNLGGSYFELDNEKAILYFNKALKIYTKIFGESYLGSANTYNNLGAVYDEIKEYDKALDYYQKCIKIYESNPQDAYQKISPLMNIGNLYGDKEEYGKALIYYNKALDIGKEKSKTYFENIIDINNKLGLLFLRQKKYLKALSYFDEAIKVNTEDKKTFVYNTTIDPNNYIFLKMLFKSFKAKASIFKELYIKNQKAGDLDKAIQLYTKLDQLVDHFRKSYQNYQDKVVLAKQAKEMYTDAIKAQFVLYNSTNDQKALDKAFYYSGKSKSNILKDLLLDSSAKNFTGLPDEIISLEKSLRSYRSFYQSKIVEEQSKDSIDKSSIQKYEGKLFEITRQQDSITKVMEQDYPKYYHLKHQNTLVSVSEIQQQLDKTTTLLEFFTSDSITYAFIISKNTFALKELSTPQLSEDIDRFKKAIISQDLKIYTQLGNDIYKELIAPLKDRLIGDRLIIIPDGSIWHLNFDSLITKETDSKNPILLPYLLKDYAISYANSAALLFSSIRGTTRAKKQKGCLAFSFSDSANVVDATTMSMATLRDSGDDLPGTRREIKAIADIIGGQYFYGSKAIETNFKKNVKDYSILHLALHGEVDNQRPLNSKLFFTKSKDTVNDDLLYSHELFALEIPAELVVLSACNTGSGKIAKGEGIMSLGNAFQYAGAKSLLLTRWEVSDQTTPELMKYFYSNLKEGMDKSKALQQAKLTYLNKANVNRTHPFYWNGFYILGNPSTIYFEKNMELYWVIGFVIVAIVFLIFFILKRKKKLLKN